MNVEFEQATPVGPIHIALTTDAAGLTYEAAGPVSQSRRMLWSSVGRAGTAILAAPSMRRREMLVVAYRDPGGATRDVHIPLPEADARDALVAEIRAAIGARWVGEGMPLQEAQTRLGTSSRWRSMKVWLFILGILGCLLGVFALGVITVGVLAEDHLVCLYAFVGGALLFRHGFREYRNRLTVADTPTAKASSAAIGLAELFGRARGRAPSPAPISGRPSAYWKVEVRQWHPGQGKKDGSWRTLLQRESEPLDTIQLEDDTGRILVWTRGATLMLQEQEWRSQDGAPLPEAGRRLLGSLGRPWPPKSDPHRMTATEKRLEDGGPLYVMGTLAERGSLPSPSRRMFWEPRPSSRSLQNGPTIADVPVAAWAVLKLLLGKKLGRSATPPDGDAHQVLVWKGTARRPFIIADRPERETARELSKRMWLALLVGAAVMIGALYFFLRLMEASW